MTHEGPGHADVTLSLSGEAPGGGHWHQGWNVCECGLGWLRDRLGLPQYESLADADSVRRVAQFVKDDPGRTHLLGEEGLCAISGWRLWSPAMFAANPAFTLTS